MNTSGKKKLSIISFSGNQLMVLLTEGEPLENVPKSASEQGFKVLEITHVKDNVHQITIEK